MRRSIKEAADLHRRVPPDWYSRSIRENIFQRFWHNRRFVTVEKLIEPIQGEILDIGSADGTFTQVLVQKSRARRIVGIDVVSASVEFAKERFKQQPKYSFRVADAHKLPFRDACFSAVFCLEVIEHVFDPKQVLCEIYRVLKPGKYAVILVPVEESVLFRTIWWVWTKWRGKVWQGTHLNVFRNEKLVKLFKKAGFIIEEDKRFLLGMLQVVKVRKPRRLLS